MASGVGWVVRTRAPAVRRFAARLSEAEVGVHAAALAYSFLFSLVPLVLLLAALLGELHLPGPGRLLATGPGAMLAPGVRGLLRQSVQSLLRRPNATALSLGALGYVWGMSGALRQLLGAVRRAYDGPAAAMPPWWWTYAWSLVLSASVGLLLIAEVALTLAGRALLASLLSAGGGAAPALVVEAVRWGGMLVLFVVLVAALYRLAPGRSGRVWPGALTALAAWLVASWALNQYVTRLAPTGLVFGTLGTVVLLLLYLYVVAIAVLLGAHLNAFLGEGGAGSGR